MGLLDNIVYFIGQKWFPRPQRTRIKPMEVLCLGFSRTGTESLCNALRTLGYNGVYHGYSEHGQAGDWAMWNKACMAKFRGVGKFSNEDWDDLLGDYQVVSDMPCILFARELIEAYPNAKVILSTRSFHSWHNSITSVTPPPSARYLTYFLSWFHFATLVQVYTSAFLVVCQKMPSWSKTSLKAAYEEHNALIRGLVPKERLLEFHVSKGWEPLCEFLGKPVPEGVPVPCGNGGEEFKGRHAKLWMREFWPAIRNFLLFMTLLVALIVYAVFGQWL
ncbi:hypothetical protein AC578_6530 [Pseudocercospora eumusae]|uniref:NAD dependent epimerase/dehydratase n=1 Tax=Pseudocercospora eumusae TaxID=321146 RepID=A0A139HHX4_9PEZI|nr:hypothetical protein AC578_6530 [Pseudocercospora eumusae]